MYIILSGRFSLFCRFFDDDDDVFYYREDKTSILTNQVARDHIYEIYIRDGKIITPSLLLLPPSPYTHTHIHDQYNNVNLLTFVAI